MDKISKYNVVHRYEKRALLVAINCVGSLAIFFFGYDQGMMGSVNVSIDYAVNVMKFGHVDPDSTQVTVDNTLLQGGIVSDTLFFFIYDALECLHIYGRGDYEELADLLEHRLPFTIWAVWWAACWGGGSLRKLDVSKSSRSDPFGAFLAPVYSARRRTRTG